MRLFLPPTHSSCVVCNRPAPAHALTCIYCGEELPHRRQQIIIRLLLSGTALLCTVAMVITRGGVHFPGPLTLPAAVLIALGSGLSILPPVPHGVAETSRSARARKAAQLYFGGMTLALLTALFTAAAGAPAPWDIGSVSLAVITGLSLIAIPGVLGLPWHKLAAGILLGAGALV